MRKVSPKNSIGFTLIEILLVIAIIATFSTFIFINYRKSQPTYGLLAMAQKINFNLRKVQNMAMNSNEFNGSVPRGGYGIYFSANESGGIYSYIIFADSNGSKTYDSSLEKVEEIKLDAGVQSSLISIVTCSPPAPCSTSHPASGYIIFIPPDPAVIIGSSNPIDNATELSVTLTLESSSVARTIAINKVGKIDIE